MAESKPKAKKKSPDDNPNHVKHLRNMLSTYRGMAGPTHPLVVPPPSEAGYKGQVSQKVEGDDQLIPAKTGEYVIPEPVVRRKGTQFFDNLIKKCLEETIPAGRDKGNTVAQAEAGKQPQGYQQGGAVGNDFRGAISPRLAAARDFYAGGLDQTHGGMGNWSPRPSRGGSGMGVPSFQPGGAFFSGDLTYNTNQGWYWKRPLAKMTRDKNLPSPGWRRGGEVRTTYDQRVDIPDIPDFHGMSSWADYPGYEGPSVEVRGFGRGGGRVDNRGAGIGTPTLGFQPGDFLPAGSPFGNIIPTRLGNSGYPAAILARPWLDKMFPGRMEPGSGGE